MTQNFNIASSRNSNIEQNKVYNVTDFSNCVRYNFNRSVRKDLVRKYKALLEGGEDMGFVILNPTPYTNSDGKSGYGILDGQHRVEAYEQIRAEGKTLSPTKVLFYNPKANDEDTINATIQNFNKGAHWNLNDFIKSNMDGDNELKRLENFCLNYDRLWTSPKTGKDKGVKKANMRRGAAYVCGDKKYYTKALKDGTFKVDEEKWQQADTTYKEMEVLLKGMRMDSLSDNPSLEAQVLGWTDVKNDYTLRNKLNKLPKGVNDLCDFMDDTFDVRNTTKSREWKDRFSTLVNRAYAALI